MVSDHDTTIEVLKMENEHLEGEKGGLANSLAALWLVLVEREKEVEVLKDDLTKARDVEALSTEQARKANELSEGLHRELTAEKESMTMLGQQLSMTTKCLDLVKGVLATIVGQYRVTIAKFEDETSALLEEDSAFTMVTWLKRHLAKLPRLINGCTNFGALARVSNFAAPTSWREVAALTPRASQKELC